MFFKNKKFISVIEEPFSLFQDKSKKFLFKPIEILEAYRYIDGLNKLEYKYYEDFIVDFNKQTLKRTKNSSIKDYGMHHVSLDKHGKFIFEYSPLHPEQNFDYQFYVKYKCERELKLVRCKSSRLSEKLKNKFANSQNVKACLIGDSIACGADTSSFRYNNFDASNNFLSYFKNFLEDIYSNNVETLLLAKGGAMIDFIEENVDKLLSFAPDIVLIEFGMNDHLNVDKAHFRYYVETLESFITLLRNKGIEIVLVGFFQQNQSWNIENPSLTKKYNNALRKIASKHKIFFADIYSVFKKFSKIKNIDEDILADFIHHPNDFGHKIYASVILPYFLLENKINKDLPEDFIDFM